MDVEQERLLSLLLDADLNKPVGDDGLGGPGFAYIQLGEGQFDRHPGLEADVFVRTPADIRALFVGGYIQGLDHPHGSFKFTLTDKATSWRERGAG